MKNTPQKSWLLAAGTGSALVALLHAAIIAVGPAAYRYFGAGNLAPLAEQGSWTPALVTAGLVCIFGLWALYAFSGAGWVRRLPWLKPVLFVVGAIYALRGLVLFADLYFVVRGVHPEPRMTFFSLVSLLLGSAYLAGAAGVDRSKV